MARFTNIGMPRKTFVASAAEEARTEKEAPASPPPEAGPSTEKSASSGKRKGWGRDPEIAKRAKDNTDRSEQRRLMRIDERAASTTCFACRGLGHSARDCPNILLAATGQNGSAAMLEADDMAARQAKALAEGGEAEAEAVEGKGKKGKKNKAGKEPAKDVTGASITGGKCYRCNSSAHSLKHCPKRADKSNPTPYATCFVCLGQGHLSAACPKNPRGVYVNGGSCKVCGSVAHRANDCPDDKRGPKPAFAEGDGFGYDPTRRGPAGRRENILGTGRGAGADEDDFMAASRGATTNDGFEFQGNRTRHAPAKNGQRGIAKRPGEEGAFVPTEKPAPAAAKPKPKKKVVSF